MEHYKNLSSDNIVEEINGITITEEWKPVLGYEGLYEVSNFGRVKCLERRVNNPRIGWSGTLIHGRVMKQSVSKIGYLEICLSKNGSKKNYMPHRLVGEAFIPNPLNKPQINHLFGIKSDNRVSQLEWATKSEDQIHSYKYLGRRSRFSYFPEEKRFSKKVVCSTLDMSFKSVREATNMLGLNKDAVTNICKGKLLHVRGLVFRYA